MADLDVLVAGDAAITFAWQVSAAPTAGRTSKLLGAAEPEARFGGCAPGVALALAGLGHRVALVSWLGDDHYGRAYVHELRSRGVDTAGVEVAKGQASARALMFYDPSGRATCLHHPSGSGNLALPEAGRDRLVRSRWLALTAGPALLSEALLGARPQEVRVAWDVKADPSHYPRPLRQRIVRESDLLIFNRDELGFLVEALEGAPSGSVDDDLQRLRRMSPAILVLTDGAAGSRVFAAGTEAAVPAERIDVEDPTGVGDAFFSAFLSALIQGRSPLEAGRSATGYAAEFLRRRARASPAIAESKERTA